MSAFRPAYSATSDQTDTAAYNWMNMNRPADTPALAEAPKPDRDLEPLPNSLSLGFVERLYASYVRDPASVSADWRNYFRKIGDGAAAPVRLAPSFRPRSVFNPSGRETDGAA